MRASIRDTVLRKSAGCSGTPAGPFSYTSGFSGVLITTQASQSRRGFVGFFNPMRTPRLLLPLLHKSTHWIRSTCGGRAYWLAFS